MYMLEALKLENNRLRRTIDGLKKDNGDLENKLAEAKQSAEFYRRSAVDFDGENDRLREAIDGKEKEINSLKKTIHELEKENTNLRITPTDANAIEVLRGENEMLWSRIEEVEIGKRPWHGDGNAMTGARTCCESLAEAVEFQNKKIEELEAEKARLKEVYDIQETTIKRLKLLLGKEHKETEVPTDHEFEFGDKVFVPWSYGPYMYVKSGLMYNPRTERLVYVGKTQHLKWFGERFEIK